MIDWMTEHWYLPLLIIGALAATVALGTWVEELMNRDDDEDDWPSGTT